MKVTHLLAGLTCVTLGVAQQVDLLSAISHLPACAQACLTTSIATSPCASDLTLKCICADAKFNAEAEACIMSSCTLRQSLTTKNATTTMCHAPIRSKNNQVRVSNIIVAVVGAACTLARLVYKAVFTFGELGLDDYSVLLATVAGAPSVVLIDRKIVTNGIGLDVWTVPFDKITEFARYLYILECMYFLQIALVKLTLLFFFMRIFPKPIVRRLLWATVIFDCLWATAFVITAVFQCRPISYYWTKWDLEHEGTCVNINALAWTNAIISLSLDVWMLVLPLWEICQLQLSWRKKVSVAIMFFVGTFVTVVSALRVQSLVHFATSANPTWDQTDVISWSNIEINVGIICACLPTLRIIFMRMFPRVFGTTQDAKSGQKYGSKGYGKRNTIGGGSSGRLGGSAGNTITFTKSFVVSRVESDETSLVQMDEFGEKGAPSRTGGRSARSF